METVLDEYGFANSTVLRTAMPCSDSIVETPFDPARVQALIHEVGVRIDQPLKLLASEGNRSREREAEELEENFGLQGNTLQTELVGFANAIGRG